MRTRASVGWRVATAVAFGATAALAVTLSHGGSLGAALTSDKGTGATHAAASPQAAVEAARCALSGLRISLGPGARLSKAAITSYPLDFTNVSGAPCTIAGYPEVTAYRGDGIQVGAAAARDASAAARRVLLAPGQTAHAVLDALLPAARCNPVRAAGVRVIPPGQTAARYVQRVLTACAAAPSRGAQYLRVHAIQPGPGTGPGAARPAAGTVGVFWPAAGRSRPVMVA
jgi:Protein of unknown function (DUF4232)